MKRLLVEQLQKNVDYAVFPTGGKLFFNSALRTHEMIADLSRTKRRPVNHVVFLKGDFSRQAAFYPLSLLVTQAHGTEATKG